MEVLQRLVLADVCHFCQTGDLILSETGREGLVSYIKFQCTQCDQENVFPLGEKNGRFFDLNRRSVLAMRRIGRGHTALQKFCGVRNMPGPVH